MNISVIVMCGRGTGHVHGHVYCELDLHTSVIEVGANLAEGSSSFFSVPSQWLALPTRKAERHVGPTCNNYFKDQPFKNDR